MESDQVVSVCPVLGHAGEFRLTASQLKVLFQDPSSPPTLQASSSPQPDVEVRPNDLFLATDPELL